MLIVTCLRCQETLTQPGALMFSPPVTANAVAKFHLCRACFDVVYQRIVNEHSEAARTKEEAK